MDLALLITIALLTGIFIIIVLLLFNKMPETNITRTSNSVPFLGSCFGLECDTGLICDPATYTCKKKLGTPCNQYSDCAGINICSGVCTVGGGDGLGTPCPCTGGFVCVENPGKESVCKYGPNHPCTEDSQCSKNFCDNGFCTFGIPNGLPCSFDESCTSLNCSRGYCQLPTVTSGDIGSICGGTCNSAGLQTCNAMTGAATSCKCSGNSLGICVISDLGIANPCNGQAICANTLLCTDVNGNQSLNGMCAVSYPRVNNITTNVCPVGMTAKGDNCVNAVGMGCEGNNMCTGTCNTSDGGVLVKYTFGGDNTIMNRGNIAIKQVSKSGINITPRKTFSKGNNLYFVALSNGVYLFDGSKWTKEVPGNFTIDGLTGYLVDACLYKGDYLVVINTIKGSLLARGRNDNWQWFNVTNDPPGAQFSTGGGQISIMYIDSNDTDVLLTTQSQNVFISVPGTGSIVYEPFIVTGGPLNGQTPTVVGGASFYHDDVLRVGIEPPVCPPNGINMVQCSTRDNIAFISTTNRLLQFSGNAAGQLMPTDVYTPGITYLADTYSISSTKGILNSNIIVKSLVNTNIYQVAVYMGQTFSFLPYLIGGNSAVVAADDGLYVYSTGTCVS